jgi:RNA polymerase sigma-B factor
MEAGRAYRSTSLDGAGADDGRLSERLAVEVADYGNAEWRSVFRPHLNALPERDLTILQLRFVEGLTQSEIADRVGISQMHVSRLLGRSIVTLRETCTGVEAH